MGRIGLLDTMGFARRFPDEPTDRQPFALSRGYSVKPILLPFLLSATALFAQSPRHFQAGLEAGAIRYLELPMRFEPNVGAVEQPVPFLSRGPGYTLFLSSTQAVLSLRSTVMAEFTMNLVGANPRAHVEGLDKLP